MRIVSPHEAKTDLPELVEEEFVISRDDRPVARVTPIKDHEAVPRFGFLPDMEVPDDFDQMGSETLKSVFASDRDLL